MNDGFTLIGLFGLAVVVTLGIVFVCLGVIDRIRLAFERRESRKEQERREFEERSSHVRPAVAAKVTEVEILGEWKVIQAVAMGTDPIYIRRGKRYIELTAACITAKGQEVYRRVMQGAKTTYQQV